MSQKFDFFKKCIFCQKTPQIPKIGFKVQNNQFFAFFFTVFTEGTQEKAIKLESKSYIFRQKRKIYYFNLPNHNFRKVQCDFASFRAGNLGTHLKIHSGEKSNKCNQCNYVSSQTSNLRTHLKTHSEEK